MLNTLTTIPAPRVPLINADTGLISTEWYRFLFNLYTLSGSGSNITSLDELQIGPPAQPTTATGGGSMVYPGSGIANSTGSAWATSYTTTGTGSVVALQTSPTLITPILGTPTSGNFSTGTFTWPTFNQNTTGYAASLAGGLVGSLPYQSAINTTVFLAAGTNGQVLTLAAGVPSWATPTTGTVTSVTGTSPVNVATGTTTPVISLASGYGDTQNPYASKTANYVLAAPNGSAGVPTFRALVSGDVTGLGTMATQNANAVAITCGTINGTTIGATTATTGAFTTVTASTSVTTPIVQATNSAGLSLKNASGTTQISMGAGGGDNASINVSTNINGTNAQIDISPTGTGHVHMKPTGTGSIEIAPTNVGTMDNMTIGATTARAITGTTITATSFVGSGASLTNVVNSLAASTGISVSGSTGAVTVTNTAPDQTVVLTAGTGISTSGTYPNFTITNTSPSSGGTVTSVTGTAPVISSGGNTPAISMAAATTSVNGYLTSTDWTTFNSKQAALVSGTNIKTVGGNSLLGSGDVGTIGIAYGGTGQTTASAAFNALSPITTTGDLILGNGTNSATRLAIGANTYVLTSNGTTASWSAPAGGGSNITTYGLWENSKTISANYSITSGNSATSAGPITINSGVSVTVPSGSRWVVL